MARHVVASSWIALIATGATGGIFATAGSSIISAILGEGYGAELGAELGRVVVALVPWMVVTVGVSLVFPLVFVGGAGARLLLVAGLTIGAIVPLAFAGRELAGLTGLALALAVSTGVALVGMLHLLGAARATIRGLVPVAGVVGLAAFASYAASAALVSSVGAAVVGTALYALCFVISRPAGLSGLASLHRLGPSRSSRLRSTIRMPRRVLKIRCASTRRHDGWWEVREPHPPVGGPAPASNGGGSSETLTACAVRKLTAGSSFQAGLARTKSTIDATAGRYASSRRRCPPTRT